MPNWVAVASAGHVQKAQLSGFMQQITEAMQALINTK